MSRHYALKTTSGDVFTRGGAALVHDNREELEFLFPGREAVDITGAAIPKTWWKHHPQMDGIRFPLVREDFR